MLVSGVKGIRRSQTAHVRTHKARSSSISTARRVALTSAYLCIGVAALSASMMGLTTASWSNMYLDSSMSLACRADREGRGKGGRAHSSDAIYSTSFPPRRNAYIQKKLPAISREVSWYYTDHRAHNATIPASAKQRLRYGASGRVVPVQLTWKVT